MKSEAEKLSKLKKYKSFLHCYRLPQLKTSSNYNFLGFYEGKKISSIKNEILKFLDI